MTEYCVTAADNTLALKAGTRELKLNRIIYVNGHSTDSWISVWRRDGTTLSGGAAADVVPLRQQAPAATATARTGASLTMSGTAERLAIFKIASGSTGSDPGLSPGAAGSFESPLDITIAPGNVLYTTGLLDTYRFATIYFEELTLSWSY